MEIHIISYVAFLYVGHANLRRITPNVCLGVFFNPVLPNSTINCTQLVASLFHTVTGLGGLALTSAECILRISMWSRREYP
jgi:hypothetical protein